MKNMMIILFSYLGIENVYDFAFERIKDKDNLIIFGVIEKNLPKVNKLISNTSLGDKISKELEKDIIDVYKKRINEAIETGQQRGKNNNINIKRKLINTTSICNLSEIISIEEIDHLIINYTSEKFFEKYILDCSLDKTLEEIEVPCTLFYDGKILD